MACVYGVGGGWYMVWYVLSKAGELQLTYRYECLARVGGVPGP